MSSLSSSSFPSDCYISSIKRKRAAAPLREKEGKPYPKKQKIIRDKFTYMLAYHAAKHKKPYRDVEIWKDIFANVAKETDLDLNNVTCSRFTIAKCVEELSISAKDELKAKIKKAIWLSIALDETTDLSHTSQLVIFIRGVFSNSTVFEEMLDLCRANVFI
ncbi:hypothetical protein DMENIID0001_149260 [Sergentomyia squamirostris]